jgi:hypothetical protein
MLKNPCPPANDPGWVNKGSYKYQKFVSSTTPSYTTNFYYYPNGLSVEDLPPGIHCVDNGIGKGNYVGNEILVVLLSGGIQQTGNDSVNWRADGDLKDKDGNQLGGLVFYAPSSNTNELKFGGNSGANFYGTIYAPGATCDIGGTEDSSAMHTSIVCNTVKFHGNPTTYVLYNPAELFHFPPSVEVVQ